MQSESVIAVKFLQYRGKLKQKVFYSAYKINYSSRSYVKNKSGLESFCKLLASRRPHLSIFGGASPLPPPLTRDFHVSVSFTAATLGSTEALSFVTRGTRSLAALTQSLLPPTAVFGRCACDPWCPLNKFEYRYCLPLAKNRTYSMSTPTVGF